MRRTERPENPPTLQTPSLNVTSEPDAERLFSADFSFATLANFFNTCGGQMMNTILPVYVLSLGGSTAEAGLVGGAAAITALLFRSVVGWVTDVWRRRPVVLIGSSCFGIASVVYAVSGSIGMLLLGRFIQGFGLSCYSTASNSYVADIAPPKRRAEAIGLFAATASLSMIIGPAIGFYIISLVGYQWLFNLTTALFVVGLVVSLFARERHAPPKSEHRTWSWRTGILAVNALPLAWTAFCLGMSNGSILTFAAIFASSRGIANPGIYFTIQAIALVMSRTLSGRFADKRGHAFAIIPGSIAMMIGLLLLPSTYEFLGFAVSAVLMGLGFGMAQPATMALLVNQVDADQRGLGIATYFIGYDGGISLGSAAFGVVSQVWGFGVMWPLSAACALLGLVGLFGARGNRVAALR